MAVCQSAVSMSSDAASSFVRDASGICCLCEPHCTTRFLSPFPAFAGVSFVELAAAV